MGYERQRKGNHEDGDDHHVARVVFRRQREIDDGGRREDFRRRDDELAQHDVTRGIMQVELADAQGRRPAKLPKT